MPGRYFITGTDTDVGKTRVTAGLARALVARGRAPASAVTIVKLAQTGLRAGDEGDAAIAARAAGCDSAEFARFALPADPWNAALAEGAEPLDARMLATRLDAYSGTVVVEGSGGAAVPLNAHQTIADVARLAGLETVVVVALRLGCISHALLTAAYLERAGIPLLGAVLVARFAPLDRAYRRQVERGIRGALPILGALDYEQDLTRGVAQAEALFAGIGDLALRD